MLASILSLALTACVWGQVEAQGQTRAELDPQKRREEIARAVERLGDKRFSVREAAGRFLWRQDEAAVPALREAAESADRETRTRAKQILADIEFGIRAGVAPAEAVWMREFRDGASSGAQVAVLRQVVLKERIELAGRLIGKLRQTDARRQTLDALLQNADAAEILADAGRLEKLVDAIGADQEAAWRAALVDRARFSPLVLKRLTEQGRIAEFMAPLETQDDPVARQQMLGWLLANGDVMKTLLEQKKLEGVLAIVAKQPQQQQRQMALMILVMNFAARATFVEHGGFETVLKFSGEHLDAAARAELHEQIVFHGALVFYLLEKHRIDRLLELLAAEKDADARGSILGVWLATDDLWASFHERDSDRWLAFARGQSSPATRRSFLKLLATRAQPFRSEAHARAAAGGAATMSGLWAVIREENEPVWQVEMLSLLLKRNCLERRLADENSAAWIVALAHGESTRGKPEFLHLLLADAKVANRLVDLGQFDALLDALKSAPEPRRGDSTARLVELTSSLARLKSPGRLALVASLGRDEKSATARAEYFRRIVGSPAVVAASAEADQCVELAAAIRDVDDPKLKSELWAGLFQHAEAVDLWAKTKRLDELLAYGRDAENVEMRRDYYRRLLVSAELWRAMADDGRLENLVELWRQEPDDDQRLAIVGTLLATPKTASLLMNGPLQKDVVELLDGTTASTASMKRCIDPIFASSSTLAALVEAGRTERLLVWSADYVKTDDARFAYQANSRFVALLRNVDAVGSLTRSKRFDAVLEEALSGLTPQRRQATLRTLGSDSKAIDALAIHGRLESVLKATMKAGEIQLAMNMFSAPQLVSELEFRNRLEIVFELGRQAASQQARQERPEPQPQPSSWLWMLKQSTLLDALLRNGFVERIVEVIEA